MYEKIRKDNMTNVWGRYPEYKRILLSKLQMLAHEISDRSKIVSQKQGDYPEALVKGWSEALQQIQTTFEKDLLEKGEAAKRNQVQ